MTHEHAVFLMLYGSMILNILFLLAAMFYRMSAKDWERVSDQCDELLNLERAARSRGAESEGQES